MVHPYVATKKSVHGSDGFGDAGLPKLEPILEDELAPHALIRLAKEYKGMDNENTCFVADFFCMKVFDKGWAAHVPSTVNTLDANSGYKILCLT